MIEVIYEDNHILVVNKPAGILTQPSGTDQDNLEQRAKQWIKEKYQKPGNVFLGAVHRIDKPVSGIVVFAKTSKALSRLNAVMREKRSKKIYYALVENGPKQDKATLEHYLVHDDYRATISNKQDPEAKLARLHYRVLRRHSQSTLLEIELETGRYHQIRAQLSAIHCPIVGDVKYGSHKTMGKDVIGLHHFHLELPHPVGDKLLIFEAPLPHWAIQEN